MTVESAPSPAAEEAFQMEGTIKGQGKKIFTITSNTTAGQRVVNGLNFIGLGFLCVPKTLE